MRIQVGRLATGAYQLSWSSPSDGLVPGDALLVDVRCAEASWCEMADVLVQTCPVPAQSVSEVIRALLSYNPLALMLVNLGSDQWMVRDRAGQNTTVELPGRETLLAWAVMIYCKMLHGLSLPSASNAICAHLSI